MVSRRKAVALIGSGLSIPVAGIGYCTTSGCSGIRNRFSESVKSTNYWENNVYISRYRWAEDNSNMYIPARGSIIAIDKQTGDWNWNRGLGPEVHGGFHSLRIVGDYIVGISSHVNTAKNGWAALPIPAEGEDYHMVRWDIPEEIQLPVAVNGSTLIFKTSDHLRAVNVEQKTTLWNVEFPRIAALAAGSNRLYICGRGGQEEDWILATSEISSPVREGEIIEIPIPSSETIMGSAFYNGRLFIFSNHKIVSFSPDGELEWEYELPNDVYLNTSFNRVIPERVGGNLIVEAGLSIIVLSGSEGSVLWRSRMDSKGKYLDDFAATRRAVFFGYSHQSILSEISGINSSIEIRAHRTGEILGTIYFEKKLNIIKGGNNTAFIDFEGDTLAGISIG
jgi:outer membrane protein assembly factor BamB